MALLSDCEDVEGLLVQPLGEETEGEQDSAPRVVIQTTLPTREGAVSFVLESGTAATLRPAVEGTEPSSRSECVWPLGLELE